MAWPDSGNVNDIDIHLAMTLTICYNINKIDIDNDIDIVNTSFCIFLPMLWGGPRPFGICTGWMILSMSLSLLSIWMLEELYNFWWASLVLALTAKFQMTETEIWEEVRGLTALPSPALDRSSVCVSITGTPLVFTLPLDIKWHRQWNSDPIWQTKDVRLRLDE